MSSPYVNLPGCISTTNNKNSKNETVSIKEICKKFENLSGSDGKQTSNIPTPPVRRYRASSSTAVDDKEEQQAPLYSLPNKRWSVREKTKLFESTTDGPNRRNSHSNILPSNAQTSRKHSFESSVSLPDDRSSSDLKNPPLKPPRSFVTPESNRAKVVSKLNGGSPVSKPLNGSSSHSLEYEPVGSKNFKSPRLLSAPDIKTNIKSQKTESKSRRLLNHFKNITSTTYGKIRQPKVFVDLTPTTVSPPKHYGTLKRSHSEEHIYAEPFSTSSDSEVKDDIEGSAYLHYMCTPLVKPKDSLKRPVEVLPNRESVRTMIYDSFAPLRSALKQDQQVRSHADKLKLFTDINFPDQQEPDVPLKAIQDRIIYVKSIRQVSGSSICLSPKLYEALFFINVIDSQPEVSYSFPLKVPEEYRYPLLPHICFPDTQLFKKVSVYQSETFHFTLFDKGERVLGYCLRITGWPESKGNSRTLFVKLPVSICILSRFNAPVFYKKLLFEIEKHLTLPREKCFKYIRSLQKLGVPNAGASVSIPDHTEITEDNRTVITRPLDSHTVGMDLTMTLQLLDVEILVKLVASLVLERRVLLLSSKASHLYYCCKGMSSLLYPFEWPHMFIPVLPSCLTVHCCSELPYILGICTKNYTSLLELIAEHELLIVDVDKGVVVKSCNDEDTILPAKIQKAVVTALNLAKNMTDPTEMLRDAMISEAFVHMFVEMIGHYENHFVENVGKMTFNKEGLLKNASSFNVQNFLEWFSETQMFDAFVNESIWRINYRNICQTNTRTFFEKRIDEYKWEMSHDGEKISRFIEKTVRNIGERIMHKLKK